jgi:hypothetical protein
MNIRTHTAALIGAMLAVTVPCLAQEAVAPHTLDIQAPDETSGLVIGDLSGGVGHDSAGGDGGGVVQIVQAQPSGNGVSTSASAPRFVSGSH